MKVVFRVDSSRRIGTGHFVRCLTLGSVLRERGAEVSFVSRAHEGHLLDRLTASEFPVSILPAPEPILAAPRAPEAPEAAQEAENYGAWVGVSQAEDAAQTAVELADSGPDWLVVDHYGLDAEWESILRCRVGRILVIDDLADRRHDCDVLLDQNYAPGGEVRYRGLVPTDCRLLLGPSYALIRSEYRQYRNMPREDEAMPRVFVFLGGTDRYGITQSALEVLSERAFRHLAVHVVVGPNYSGRRELEELGVRRGTTLVEGPRPHLAEAMWLADIAIGAGGTTTWERMCVGLPSLVVSIAANQRPACEALDRDGFIGYLGSIEDFTLEKLRSGLESLLADPGRLAALRAAGLRLIDGFGLDRAADALLRDARLSDARKVTGR